MQRIFVYYYCQVNKSILEQNCIVIIKFKHKHLLYSLAPTGPPLNIKTTSRTTSSLSLTWDPPEKVNNMASLSVILRVFHIQKMVLAFKNLQSKKENGTLET